jgi:Class II flagellar assembly regulator
MTGIEGIGRPAAPRTATRLTTAKRGFFVPPEPAGTDQAAAAAPLATSPGSMLTLQELGGETLADRQARRHGQDMLAALAELQRALLGGGDDTRALERLTDLAAAVPLAADRRLAAMVSAIVVRARVELARRQNSFMSAR